LIGDDNAALLVFAEKQKKRIFSDCGAGGTSLSIFFIFFAYLISVLAPTSAKTAFWHFSNIKESAPEIYIPSMIIL